MEEEPEERKRMVVRTMERELGRRAKVRRLEKRKGERRRGNIN